MKKIILLLLLSVSLSQVTLTDEQAKNITNNIKELQIQVDSLTTDTNLKTEEIDLLNKKVTSLEKDLKMTEKKVKLVKPSWYENKWLYFGYGSVLTYTLLALVEQAGHAINIF
jgi:septal ring factor EnvC (AmiA/AmiB activator)